MANRSITTKVAVEGEQQYTSALKSINAELKTLYSQMELTSSEFRNNANSQTALTAQSSNLTNIITKETEKYAVLKQALENAKNAQQQWAEKMSTSAQRIHDNTSRMNELETRIKTNSEAYNQYAQRLQAAKDKMDALQKSNEDTRRDQAETGSTIMYLQKQMSALDSEIQNDTEELEYLDRENKTLNQTLTTSTSAYTTASNTAEKYETALNKEKVTINELDDALKKNDQYLDEAKASTDGCATSIDQFGNKLKVSNEELDGANESVSDISEGFSALSSVISSLGIEQALSKISDALKTCSETAANFEYSMATVEAVSGATDEQLEQLSSKAEEWAGSTIYLADDISDTYVQMGRAGWNASDMLDSMQGVMSLAAASGEDLASVTTIVTTALTAFGEDASEAGHFADVLSETAADSSTNVAQLGEAFKAVGTTAGNLDYEIDDVATALGAMASQSLRGELAGTALSTALTRMSGANANASKEMEELGISMYDANGQAKPLMDFLNELRDSFAQFGDDAQAAQVAAYKLAGQRGMKGLMAIVNTSQEDWDSLTESIGNCTGAADAMADTQLDTYTGDVQLLESAISDLEITIGDNLNGSLRTVTEHITDFISKINEFVSSNDNAVPAIMGVVAALTAFTGGVTIAATATAVAKTVIGSEFVAALGAASMAIAPIAAVIGGLTAAFLLNESSARNNADSLLYMVREAEEANDAVAGLEEEHSEYKKSAAETAADNQELVSSLLNLVDHYHGSAAAAEEINSVITTLNGNIPGLNLSFDSLNGTLNMTAEELEKTAEAAQLANDVTEAYNYSSNLKTAMDDAYDAADTLYKKYQDDKQAFEDYNAAVLAGEKTFNQGNYTGLQSTMEASKAAWEAQTTEANRARMEYQKSEWALTELENEYDKLTGTEDDNTEATDAQAAAAERCAARAEEQAEAEAEAAEETSKANETLRDIKSSINNVSGSTEEMRDQYEELEKEYEKLDGAGNEYLSNLVKQRLEQLNIQITAGELAEELPMLKDGYLGLANALVTSGYSADTFVDSYNDMLDSIVGGFDELEKGEGTIKEWVAAMDQRQGIQSAWNDNMTTLVDAVTDASTHPYLSASPAFQQAVQTMMDGGVETYGTAASELANAVKTGNTDVIKSITSQFYDASSEAEQAAINAYSMATGKTTTEIQAMIDDATLNWDEGTQQLTDAAGNAVTTAGDEVAENSAVADAMGTVISDAVSAGEEDAEQFTAVGEAIDTNTGSGITNNSSIIQTALSTTLTTVKTGTNVSYFSAIGIAIDQGIAKGIRSGSGLIKTAAKSAAMEAYNSAKSSLQINSPSKLFRNKIGGGIVEGLVAGLENGHNDIKKAAARMALATVPDVGGVSSMSAETTAAAASNSSVYGSNNSTWNITVNAAAGQSEQEIANAVMSQINAKIRRQKGARA